MGKKDITINNAFQKTLNESKCKPNKTWVDKCIEFHNRSMKSFLQENDIEMHSTHNEDNHILLKDSLES